jgi:hypothetical protein
MAAKSNLLKSVYSNDPVRTNIRKRFETGKVVSTGGGTVEIEVGARLPDGAAQTMTIPVATGFNPSVGQTVGIQYINDDPNGAYAVANGDASTADGATINKTMICISLHVPFVDESIAVGVKQAATKNLSDRLLTVVGVTGFAQAVGGTPQFDVYEGSGSILSGLVSLAAGATVYEGTVSDASIALDAEISVRCVTDAGESITGLTVCLWCKVGLPS